MVLLTNEDSVKELTTLSENIHAKYIQAGILEAQERKLKAIIGTQLLKALKSKVENGTISNSSNSKYKALLDDHIKFFLAYACASEVCVEVSLKVGNLGVVKTSDEHVENATMEEMTFAQSYYQSKADSVADEMQGFLLDNRKDFPELSENTCNQIKAHLLDSATCGIYLGGARGKENFYNPLDYIGK